MSDLPKAKTRPASNWSAIWVLPLIALIIGGWLGWRAYSQQGIEIQVRFESGEGIQVNKTEVVYKGMTVGKVKTLALDDEGSNRGVIATIEMNKDVEQYLKTNTRFWLVKPSVSLAGITGLETLVSGNYIAASPGDGEPTRKFKALSEEPPLSDAKPGLHLTLKADRLGSLNRGSPVFYKQIQVGQVKSYLLSEDQSTVEVKVYIEPTYANLVRKHTRFWNASGISIDANLSGLKVRSESLSSIVAGGIAFATPENRKDSPPTDPSLPFRLYEDFDAAAAGIKVKVKLTDFEGLQAGRTPVMYKGIQVGSLKTLKIDADLSSASAELTLDPLAEDYLVEDTQFWVVKPSISLAGITGLEALVKGNYIAIRPGDKGTPPQREYVARAKAPPLDLRSPGLHMVLLTDSLGSLDVGSPILYKQVKVGSVQSYQFSRKKKTTGDRRSYREGIRKPGQRLDALLECQRRHPHGRAHRRYPGQKRIPGQPDGGRYRLRNAGTERAIETSHPALSPVCRPRCRQPARHSGDHQSRPRRRPERRHTGALQGAGCGQDRECRTQCRHAVGAAQGAYHSGCGPHCAYGQPVLGGQAGTGADEDG